MYWLESKYNNKHCCYVLAAVAFDSWQQMCTLCYAVTRDVVFGLKRYVCFYDCQQVLLTCVSISFNVFFLFLSCIRNSISHK